MDSHFVRRLEVVETGRRRRWSAERKHQIVEESLQAGVSASSVARRHGISPSHLFLWRKAHREGGLEAATPRFVRLMPEEAAGPRRSHDLIEIVARNGRRLVVGVSVDGMLLTGLLRAVERE